MRILVLGGTRFVGRSIVERAVARNHAVTLLHRAHSNADLFPELEHVIADRTREAHLGRLHGQTWDAVIDCSGYALADVERTARLLSRAVGRYVFVSTAAVYAGVWGSSWAESTALVSTTEDSYRGRKRASEQVLEALYGRRCTITRPGIIVGPEDQDDRIGYWLRRIVRGGEILVPGLPAQIVQMIDAEDHASFVVDLVEQDRGGCFNVGGEQMTIREFLDECSSVVTTCEPDWTWVPGRALAEIGMRREDTPDHLPFWSPEDSMAPRLDVTRAVAAGLSLRPVSETARSVLACARFRHEQARYMSEVRESELLRAWRSRNDSPVTDT